MEWFKKLKGKKPKTSEKKLEVPDGLWVKCENCKAIIYKKEVIRNANVCPKCNYHFRINARERLDSLFDNGEYTEFAGEFLSDDPLKFVDSLPYPKRLAKYSKSSEENEAIVCAIGTIDGVKAIIAAMEYRFMGGSMGSVVGEKVTLAAEKALAERLPLIIVSASGGARMQEGILSLMQMAKASAALARLDEAGIPYISVLTDPTTGGVTASYAMLGDLNIAEPKALIGFAGPRVIKQTIRQDLPEGFQRSEFLLKHGMVDMVTKRKDLRDVLIKCLRFMTV
jgi:acetyl-CoA carboxylase carboxyl transferase subunit beta